jgi:hypothetical protein
LQTAVAATMLALCLTQSAHATLIEVDLVSGAGDGYITRDTRTDLEWLDLTRTLRRSMNDILGGFGGWLALGFRYADGKELRDLLLSAGITEGSDNSAAGIHNAQAFLTMFGASYHNNDPSPGNPFGQQSTWGIYADPFPVRSDVPSVTYAAFSASDNMGSASLTNQIYPDASDSLIGSFLVRSAAPTAIAEPGTLMLVAIGLTLFGVGTRRGGGPETPSLIP